MPYYLRLAISSFTWHTLRDTLSTFDAMLFTLDSSIVFNWRFSDRSFWFSWKSCTLSPMRPPMLTFLLSLCLSMATTMSYSFLRIWAISAISSLASYDDTLLLMSASIVMHLSKSFDEIICVYLYFPFSIRCCISLSKYCNCEGTRLSIHSSL